MRDKLNKAVEDNNLEEVKKILNDDPNSSGSFAMYTACEKGYLDIVKCLYKNDKRFSNYVIMSAIEQGHIRVVDYLLENTSEYLEEVLEDVFVHTIEYNQLEILKLLVRKYKFNIHINDDVGLCLAAKSGNLKLVKYFIQHNADVHAQNEFPIRIALEYKYFDMVKYLVNKL